VEERIKQYRAAVADAARAVTLNPLNLSSRSILALSYDALGDLTRAAAEDRAILRLDPHETGIHAQLGIIAQRRYAVSHDSRDLVTARRELLAEIAVQNELSRPQGPNRAGFKAIAALAADWAELGTIDYGLNLRGQAVQAYRQALRYAPPSPSYYRVMGLDLRQIGPVAEAIAAFGAAIRLDPRDQAALYDRGVAEALLGRLAAATADLRRAVSINARDPAAQQELAIVLQSAGDLEGAATHFATTATLLKGKPGESVAWAALGSVCDRLAKYHAAISAYRHAVAADARNTLAREELGSDLLRTHQLGAARAEFATVARQRPRDPFALYGLALIDEAQGKTSQAIAELKEAIVINRAFPAYLAGDERELGIVYATHGRWHDAANAFGHVLLAGGRSDQDIFDLGYAQQQAGDRAGARANLGRARVLARAAGHGALLQATCGALARLGAPC
jgi:tetratricopeptide (TPR) repeat protein